MATYSMTLLIWHSGKGTTIKTIKKSLVARGSGDEGQEEWTD